MSENDYEFITTDEEKTAEDDFGSAESGRWSLGDHSGVSSENRRSLKDSLDEVLGEMDDEMDSDAKAVLQDASNLINNTSVTRFECPVCGLGHSHSDNKHDIRSTTSGFGVSSSFAEGMKFCPYCHCGVNELAMLMEFFGYIDSNVFTGKSFDSVRDMEPELVNNLFRLVQEENIGLNSAINQLSSEKNVSSDELVPRSSREQLKAFISLRRKVQSAANSAPIDRETSNIITQNRERLEERTS